MEIINGLITPVPNSNDDSRRYICTSASPFSIRVRNCLRVPPGGARHVMASSGEKEREKTRVFADVEAKRNTWPADPSAAAEQRFYRPEFGHGAA